MSATTPALKRSLSLRDLIVYGLLFIGPLAPVGVYGVLDARTHGAVALVYLAATLAMGLTAWSYAEMSRAIPHAGSVFAYATQGIGAPAGFFAGWLAMLDYLLIPSVAFLFCGIAMHALVPSVPAWVFTVAAFVLTTALNLAGVARAARVGFVVLVGEIVVLGIFVLAAGTHVAVEGPARAWLSPLTGTATFELSAIVGAISIAVLSYLGFDAVASFAEESTGDPGVVGRAIGWCLAASGVVFVAQTYLAALLGADVSDALRSHPERQGTAFYDVVRGSVGPWLASLLALTKAVGPAFAAMTAQAAASRLLFGMARDGRLPAALARVHTQSGVPRTSLLATAALTLAVSVWAARRDDGLDVLVSIVDVGALAAFTLLHAAVFGYFRVKHPERGRTAHIVMPSLGAIVTIWVVVAASPLAKVVAGAWFAMGVVAWVVGERTASAPT